jgi:hypothetical protein
VAGAKSLAPELLTRAANGALYFHPAKVYEALMRASGIDPKAASVAYCNTGHLASGAWFVMSEIVGNRATSLYDGRCLCGPWRSGRWSACSEPGAARTAASVAAAQRAQRLVHVREHRVADRFGFRLRLRPALVHRPRVQRDLEIGHDTVRAKAPAAACRQQARSVFGAGGFAHGG